jgi:hypothetical protein
MGNKVITKEHVGRAVLNEYCYADPYTGNRPCDNGCICDRCSHDQGLQAEYKRKLKEAGLDA